MSNVKQLLETYHMDALRTMAEYHGLDISSSSKAPFVDGVAKIFGTPAAVKKAVEDLTPPERQAVAQIQVAGGQVSSSGLKQTLLRAGTVGPTPNPKQSGGWSYSYGYRGWYEGDPRYKGKPCYEDLMARLALRGLVFSRDPIQSNRSVIEWTPGETVFIPEFISRHLPDLSSWLSGQESETAEPAQVLAGSARTFQRDLGRFWRYIRHQGELRLTTQSYVYKADLKAINETLGVTADLRPGQGEADNGRLYFIRRLLPDLGLVEWNRSDNLEPVLDTDFWDVSAAQRVQRTFKAWRDGSGWNELLRLPGDPSGYHHSNAAPPDLVDVRKKILRYMRGLGADKWISTDVLISVIRLRDYEFLLPRRGYSSYRYGYYQSYYSTPYYGPNNRFGITWSGIEDEAEGWEVVEAGLIAHILAGPLYWMGLTDLGYRADTQPDPNNATYPQAYRLTDLGAWLLGLGDRVEIPEEGGRVVVQPNFQILAMEPISDQVLMNLDRFAEPEGGDRVMTYKLTRQSVYRGQCDEWSVPRIVSYLEKISGTSLPANVQRSLEEWQALHERITFRRGVALVQAAGKATLDQLLEDSELAPALGRRVTDTVTVPPDSAKTAGDVLRRQGWLPLVTGAGQHPTPDVLHLDADGHVRFVHAAPSIYALGRVAPYSEEVDGTRKITARAIQEAVRPKDVTVDTVLADLRAVHAGELPPVLVQNIKAWGKYYGDAKMDTLTLIEFRDQKALSELMDDPELAPHLEAFEAGRRALAVVDREHLDTVQRLLAERGVEVEWGLA